MQVRKKHEAKLLARKALLSRMDLHVPFMVSLAFHSLDQSHHLLTKLIWNSPLVYNATTYSDCACSMYVDFALGVYRVQ